MEVNVQLKTADGSVAGSLGYESAVARVLGEAGLKLYPRHPGTQDSRLGTLFRVPVENRDAADRALALLRRIDGVERAVVDYSAPTGSAPLSWAPARGATGRSPRRSRSS